MKNKKIFIIIGCILLGIILITSLSNKQTIVVSKENYKLNLSSDYNDYLSTNTLINDYLLDVSLNNQDNIKGITSSIEKNVNSKEKYNFYAEKVYYIELEKNKYYYISGRKMIYNYDTSEMSETKNTSYLINVYKPNHSYELKIIDDIDSYYSNNDLVDDVVIKKNKYNDFSIYYISYKEEDLYDNYINYFKELLFVNYIDAYDMLENSLKNQIGSTENFNIEREKIYKKLNNIVERYSIKGEEDKKTYTVILANKTKITMIEDGIMNVKYKIENY